MSMKNVALVALAGPAFIIVLVTLMFVPGPQTARQLDRRRLIKLKLWELERGLAGLSFSVALAFFITQGVKNLVGRPRPNTLAHCVPDTDALAQHIITAYGQGTDERWALVDSGICTNEVDGAFRSFPSGHASFAWAGLLYLSLYLCAKLSIKIPHLPAGAPKFTREVPNDIELLPTQEVLPPSQEGNDKEPHLSIRNLAASPPIYLLVVAFIPIAVAVWICSTRYKEFYHFGTDILAGSLLGILVAILSFRWYHLPLSTGQGWAWGPRNRKSAFGIGVGVGNYVE